MSEIEVGKTQDLVCLASEVGAQGMKCLPPGQMAFASKLS